MLREHFLMNAVVSFGNEKDEEREIIEILAVDNAKEGDKKKIRNYS